MSDKPESRWRILDTEAAAVPKSERAERPKPTPEDWLAAGDDPELQVRLLAQAEAAAVAEVVNRLDRLEASAAEARDALAKLTHRLGHRPAARAVGLTLATLGRWRL
ncbi:MAG: hypothetical protein F4098_07175 [Acidimicrobiaceae bacterium]|nr:hypothetical protein [Acidimicrobiaceae bacterium]